MSIENKEETAIATVENEANGMSLVMDENEDFVAELKNAEHVQPFCSMIPKDEKEQAQLFNAMNNPTYRLADSINKVIKVRDVYCEKVNCTNKETGEVRVCPRIVLIDEKGEGHACVSIGIFGALKKLFQSYGLPTWVKPIPLEVRQITKGERKLLTLAVVEK